MIPDNECWRRLAAISFDDPDAAFPFTARLARENGWSADYAARVVEEYRRFAYLAVSAGHEVTPSDEVDQAWHLHLTYTRRYWGEFAEALGAPLHHGPTAGGDSERDRYHGNYARTLASYERAFGAPPPRDIWPPGSVRFGDAPFMERVNRRTAYVIPKKLVNAPLAAAAAIAAALATSAAATPVEQAREFFEKNTMGVIVGVFVFLFVVILLSHGGKRGKDSSGGEVGIDVGRDSGCSGCGGCGGD